MLFRSVAEACNKLKKGFSVGKKPNKGESRKQVKYTMGYDLLQSRPPVLLPPCPEDGRKKPALKSSQPLVCFSHTVTGPVSSCE